MGKGIDVGDQAPDFTVTSHDGKQIRLGEFHDKQVVVLFFYPKDGTPMCTKEACAFRDAYHDFAEAGAVVIGVSADSEDRHRGFAAKNDLPFHLVSDRDGSLRRLFNVPKTMGFLPGRVTYVIDKAGTVRLLFNSQMSTDGHVEQALEVVRNLAE